MRVVYALACDGWDEYAQMAYLSARSLKRVHPDARAILVADRATADGLAARAHQLRECFDEIVAVPVAGDSTKLRSRAVKTTLRQAVSGDFLFLDADTLVIRPLDGLWATPADFALAHDICEEPGTRVPAWTRPAFERMGWPYPPRFYGNSGVMLVRDTVRVRELFAAWHDRWARQVEVAGRVQDQEALASALDALGMTPAVLSDDYNRMVQYHPRVRPTTRILHFFATMARYEAETVFARLLEDVAADRPIGWAALDRCVAAGHPWADPEPWLLVRSGHRFRAGWLKLRRLVGLCPPKRR